MANAPRTTPGASPRALHIRLTGGAHLEATVLRPGEGLRPPPGTEAVDWQAIASWGGTALGLVLLHGWDPDEPPPLVLAVGDAVRRGLPTAERTAVLSRSPVTSRLALGHVGGDLGSRLARVSDALVLSGRTELPGAVLVIEGDGSAALHSAPDLVGLDPGGTGRALEELFGPCASLRIGPAGEAQLACANLASGGDPPSFVGRGGLGAVLGGLGLKAVVVRGEASAGDANAASTGCAAGQGTGHSTVQAASADLTAALLDSPRLVARGRGGTLELFQAFGARGDLRGRGYGEPVRGSVARQLAREAESAGRDRHGCKGCPTPCGWSFDADGAQGGRRTGGHFSSLYALGLNVGEEHLGGALDLLRVCDAAGLDAKGTGATLALLAKAHTEGRLPDGPDWGDGAAMGRLIEDALSGDPAPSARLLAAGPAAAARELGLDREAHLVHGQVGRPESNLASVLGQCVSSGGADPMRSFPFLATDGPREVDGADGKGVDGRSREGGSLDGGGGALVAGALDPRNPAGKGRLVWWHENLVTGLDLVGFCAFSGAGLLTDGAADLDRIARWVLPEALDGPVWQEVSPARRLLAAGATVVLVARLLDRRWGAREDEDRPAWAADILDQPGMLDEYRMLRRWGAQGPGADVLVALGTEAVLGPQAEGSAPAPGASGAGRPGDAQVDAPDRARETRRPGRVLLRTAGDLGRALGREAQVEALLPAPVGDLLAQLASQRPDAAALLLRAGRPVPEVYRAGVRLRPNDSVADGDSLDLVLVVSGG